MPTYYYTTSTTSLPLLLLLLLLLLTTHLDVVDAHRLERVVEALRSMHEGGVR